jgi:hypothetical protein
MQMGCKAGERWSKFGFGSSYHSPTPGYVVSTYSRSDVDLTAVYCGELDSCHLLPPQAFEGQKTIYLRLGEPRNKQRAALNWASDYEFPGAVAQLAERSDGIRKVRGSIPLSSTSHSTVTEAAAATRHEVGAHRFRNHFGYYMEQAAGGAEYSSAAAGVPALASAQLISTSPRLLPMPDR